MAAEVCDLPKEENVYIQRENCTEEQVNVFIALGYTPWMITPVVKELRKNQMYVSSETVLVYHFLRRAKK